MSNKDIVAYVAELIGPRCEDLKKCSSSNVLSCPKNDGPSCISSSMALLSNIHGNNLSGAIASASALAKKR